MEERLTVIPRPPRTHILFCGVASCFKVVALSLPRCHHVCIVPSFSTFPTHCRVRFWFLAWFQVATLQTQLRSGEARIRGLERHVGELMRRVSRRENETGVVSDGIRWNRSIDLCLIEPITRYLLVVCWFRESCLLFSPSFFASCLW